MKSFFKLSGKLILTFLATSVIAFITMMMCLGANIELAIKIVVGCLFIVFIYYMAWSGALISGEEDTKNHTYKTYKGFLSALVAMTPALMIAILCKNFAASISCSLVLLILNYALNIIFGGAFWYTLLPGMNLHLFKFFGNSFASIIEGTTGFAGLIQSLLITGIETTMTFWYSFGMSCAYCLVFLVISYSVFQKRDF